MIDTIKEANWLKEWIKDDPENLGTDLEVRVFDALEVEMIMNIYKTSSISKLTTYEKAKLAMKWSNSRSEGDKEVDRQCYYDYLMGMEEAERMLNK